MKVIRTQDEITARFLSADDIFGVQKTELISFMSYQAAKPYLKEEYVASVDAGQDTWEQNTDPLEKITEYLPFAYEKAHNQRGLSAGRSMLHMKIWIWLCDDKFYNEILEDIENYTDYGLRVLDRIQEWAEAQSTTAELKK